MALSEIGNPIAYRKAAVLIPILNRDQNYSILFTKRNASLSQHAGQVAFPGGRFEVGDQDLSQTALREFQEEVGISAERVSLLGQLTLQLTSSYYEVVPYYGLVESPYAFQPNPLEVAELIEIPLKTLLATPMRPLADFIAQQPHTQLANLTQYEVKLDSALTVKLTQSQLAEQYYFLYQETLVWGVTAAITQEFIKTKLPEIIF